MTTKILSLFSISLSIPILSQVRPTFQQEFNSYLSDIVGNWTETVQPKNDPLLSRIHCLELAQERNYPHVFIFENNLKIEELFSPTTLEKIKDRIEKNPDWNLIFFSPPSSFSFFIVREESYSIAIQYFQTIYINSKMGKPSPPIPTGWYHIHDIGTENIPILQTEIVNKPSKIDFAFAKHSLNKTQGTALNSSISRALSISSRHIGKQKSLGFINSKHG